MANTAVYDRQKPLMAVCDLTIANIGASNGYTMKVPPSALLTEVFAVIGTAFNSATTTTLTASDGTTTFLNAVDAKSAANTRLSATVNKFFPSGGTITFSMAETGTAATAGRAIGVIQYVVLNRQEETQT